MRIVNTPTALVLALAMTTGGFGGVAVPVVAQTAAPLPTDVLQVAVGRGRLVTLSQPMTDLFVANDQIADVQVRSPTQLYIFGKSPGETTVYATTKSGKVVYSTNIRVGNNIDSVDSMLKLAMPDAQIIATPMNGLILLTGTVASPADIAEAERLVKAFVGDKVEVISRLRTATPLQVNLQVRFAEVSRSFVKNIGSNILTRDTTGGFQFGISSGTRVPGTIGYADVSSLPVLDASSAFGLPAGSLSLPFDPSSGRFVYPNTGTLYSPTKGSQNGTISAAGKLFGLDILSAFDLGERIGQVTTLATPNLTSLSGETASFLAGGEIPIPISQGLGAVSVEYKQYGVSLSFTPTVMGDGRISLRVRPEVSQLSAAGAVQLNGTTIPALTTRRSETTIELGSGESMMIAGLLQNSHDNSIDKTPGLGDIPVLGTLFRSNAFQRNETELVIVITAYLVKPVNANDIVLPTDGYKAPNDIDRVLFGQLSGGKSGSERPKPTMATPETAPSVGVQAPVPTVPQPQQPAYTQPQQPAQPRKKSKAAVKAPGANPGFSLN
ncbi:MAG: pilus assembly protein N-terminal domain-containing protein [Pseudomonadota bacterium]